MRLPTAPFVPHRATLLVAAAVTVWAGAGCDPQAPRRMASAPPTTTAPDPSTRSDAIVYRFQDHLNDAEIHGPDPERALQNLGPRTRGLANAHGRAPARRAWYLAELAFDQGRVADYLREEQWPGDGPGDRGTPGNAGLIGGGAGVVELRGGLFAPPGTSFAWDVAVPPRAYLAFDVGVAPVRPGLPVLVRVDVDGTTVWSRAVTFAEAGRWYPVVIDLGTYSGRTVGLRLAATAVPSARTAPATPPGRAPTAAPGSRTPATQATAVTAEVTRPVAAAGAIGPVLFGDPVLMRRAAFSAPNIVLITLDAVRADVVGAYGSDLGLTPNVDALAREGTMFTQAIIPVTWTRPSVVAMLGGCFPQQIGTGSEWEVTQARREQFYRGRPPLATLDLRRAGYQTHVVGNAILFVGYSPLGLDLGWDSATDVRDLVEETPGTTRAAIRVLKAHRDRPFFLYVHLDTAHLPYNPPQRLLDKILAGPGAKRYPLPNARAYLGEVAFADEQVGRIRAALFQLGLAERTVVIVTADHGETIEKEKYIVYPTANRNTLWGHGSTPYDNVLRVPLVMWKPGLIPAGRRIDAQVRTLDMAPSLLELAGAAPNPRQCARSLGPLVRGEAEAIPRVAVSFSFYATTVRAEGWKLINWRGEAAAARLVGGDTPTETMQELFDLTADPEERQDLSEKRPAEMRRMRGLLGEALRTTNRPAVAAESPVRASRSGATGPVTEAPMPPRPAPGAATVLHLRLAPDGSRHRLEARLRSPQPITVRATAGPVRIRAAGDGLALDIETRTPAEVALEVDLAAGAEIEALLDGRELRAERFRAGPFALALLDGRRVRVDRDTWDALLAPAPPPHDEAGVYLWGEGRMTDAGTSVLDPGPLVTPVRGDVAKILRGWGYLQGDEKPTTAPR